MARAESRPRADDNDDYGPPVEKLEKREDGFGYRKVYDRWYWRAATANECDVALVWPSEALAERDLDVWYEGVRAENVFRQNVLHRRSALYNGVEDPWKYELAG